MPATRPTAPLALPGDTGPLPPPLSQPKSRWTPVRWAELPGFTEDALHEAWNAWIKSCERPVAPFTALCSEVRQLSIASGDEQRAWMMARLQPYRVETTDGNPDGLLTAYYEPLMDAARQPGNGFNVPIYRTPAGFGARKPWYTRQQIETLPEAQAALQGRAIAWLRDPVESMVLHIQGSGRLRVMEPDGSTSLVRVAYAGTNDQPYMSVGRWLLDFGEGTLARIPLAGTIYKTLKQILETVLRDNSTRFRRVVLVEYPREGLFALGFVTGVLGASMQGGFSQPMLSVFIPTAPNPTTGWYCVVPETAVRDLDMTVEDAFRTIISAGIVSPDDREPPASRSFASLLAQLRPSSATVPPKA